MSSRKSKLKLNKTNITFGCMMLAILSVGPLLVACSNPDNRNSSSSNEREEERAEEGATLRDTAIVECYSGTSQIFKGRTVGLVTDGKASVSWKDAQTGNSVETTADCMFFHEKP